MNNNEYNCEETEYVFVELYPKTENEPQEHTLTHERENAKKNNAVKSGSRLKTLFSRNARGRKTENPNDDEMNSTSLSSRDDERMDAPDNLSISSFDLCDEEMADMDIEIELETDPECADVIGDVLVGPCAGVINNDSMHLELSQCPSASASVCTDTMFETMREDATVTSLISKNVGSANASTAAATSETKQSGHSRLSNKKRRKKLKKQKKAAAAAAAAEALEASKKPKDSNPATATKSSAPVVTVPVATHLSPRYSKKKQAANIAVLCAAQSLAQYRQEIGIGNITLTQSPNMNIRST